MNNGVIKSLLAAPLLVVNRELNYFQQLMKVLSKHAGNPREETDGICDVNPLV